MKDTPEIPEEFDSEEELEQYISQLHNHIEFLEEELEESEKQNLDLRNELNQLEEQGSTNGGLQEVHSKLEDFMEKMEDVELHGKPSDVGLHDTLRNPDF